MYCRCWFCLWSQVIWHVVLSVDVATYAVYFGMWYWCWSSHLCPVLWYRSVMWVWPLLPLLWHVVWVFDVATYVEYSGLWYVCWCSHLWQVLWGINLFAICASTLACGMCVLIIRHNLGSMFLQHFLWPHGIGALADAIMPPTLWDWIFFLSTLACGMCVLMGHWYLWHNLGARFLQHFLPPHALADATQRPSETRCFKRHNQKAKCIKSFGIETHLVPKFAKFNSVGLLFLSHEFSSCLYSVYCISPWYYVHPCLSLFCVQI